ncbi:MAG: hypothetical protein Q4E57_03620 [Eubacteriales bacterium]|nr:hypothetical protein [Eubacteriales bacterium]
MLIETKITLKDWEALGRVMCPRNSIYLVQAVAVICLFFAYRYYTLGNGGMLVYYIILPIVLEFIVFFSRYRRLDNHKKFFLQYYQGKELTLSYNFREDDFEIINGLTGEKSSYEYKKLAEIFVSPENMIVAAYGNQYFIFNRTSADEYGLKEFLLKKNPAIKTGKKI